MVRTEHIKEFLKQSEKFCQEAKDNGNMHIVTYYEGRIDAFRALLPEYNKD